MMDSYSNEQLVKNHLKATAKRANSRAVWLLLGGLVFAIVGGIVLLKCDINASWAIFPGSFVSAVGIIWAVSNQSECEEAFNRMQDSANFSA